GETILEVARRELWDAARIVASRLDLLGAIRYELPKPTTAYVYMCELQHLTWWYEIPEKEKSAEIGVFARLPRPVASEAVEIVLDHDEHALCAHCYLEHGSAPQSNAAP